MSDIPNTPYLGPYTTPQDTPIPQKRYRVLYNRWLVLTAEMALVEDEVQADNATVIDGALILTKLGRTVLIVPPMMYLLAEEVGERSPRILTGSVLNKPVAPRH